jgi:phospholipase/carboxylesterase
MLRDYRLAPLSGEAPDRAVIFLHGLGDRGDGGLLEIGRMWQRALPTCEFLCPDAPFPLDMAPPGFEGRQWFHLETFMADEILTGTKMAAPYLNDYIDHVLTTRKLKPSQLALVGFSQGTIMALYVAPRRGEQVACVIGYSGFLTGGESLPIEKKCAPPTLLMHGTLDEVVPYAVMALAEQGLKSAGIPVTAMTCSGTGHTIDELGLQEGLKFLLANFAKSQ